MMPLEERLGIQSMPDDLMNLCKDQFGPQFIQFEIWAGKVADRAYTAGMLRAAEIAENWGNAPPNPNGRRAALAKAIRAAAESPASGEGKL